ncbi:MAG: nitronate monooxygenase [Eubacteriales bacterium]|nr:nitronate monooxygenase [Eubacteriales bacterium]
MAHVATPEFAAAVSNAGALGQVGTGAMSAIEVKAAIKSIRELTDRPFGINLMLLNPEVEAIAELLAAEQVPLISTGAGNPGKYIPMWHEAGCKVIPVVPSLNLAKRMEGIGADAVIAEGQEAGGHIGEVSSFVLWPLLTANLEIPVIAAGGIANGRQLAAAKLLGVSGFQLGTPFLATDECPIHENYRSAVLRAKDSQITVIGRRNGLPCRLLKTPLTHRYQELEREGADKIELEKILLGSLRRAVKTGDKDTGAYMMGQSAALIAESVPIAERLAQLFIEAETAIKEFCTPGDCDENSQ